MSPEPDARAETITANVALNLAGTPFRAEITVPTQVFELRELLPTARSLSEAIIGEAVKAEGAKGNSISCRSGCGACCRQLVPVSEVEARLLRDLVEGFPEPRRSRVLARFAEAKARLAESTLLGTLRHPEAVSGDDLVPLALDYFAQGIPCPFLENESCSIYEERPVVCREYLVTSPAENCAQPTPGSVRRVALAAKVSTALTRMGRDPSTAQVRWIPLTLALEWADDHPDDLPRRTGPEWLREFFQRLTGQDIPAPKPTAKEASGTTPPA
jgi:Fe-S-cluster containining protein